MKSRIAHGAAAGLIAGVLFGLYMQMIGIITPGGTAISMMTMVAQMLDSTSLAVGWLFHLFNSAVIGALFGYFLKGPASVSYSRGLAWGALYGAAWWVVGGLLLMPIFLDMQAFAFLTNGMGAIAVANLVGHLVYGLALGGAYVRMRQPQRSEFETRVRAVERPTRVNV